VKTEGRVELKENAVPTLQISFRAKDAPDIVESIEQVPDTAEDESPGSSTADHSYSSADQEPVTSRSVEVAMKEHSYFTGVALQCASPPSGQPILPEALEAPEDHTYHTNIPIRLSLDDHTYNRGEAALVNPLSKPPPSDDLNVPPAAPIEEEQREEACIRNFDHTYNNKKSAESPAGSTIPQENETPAANPTLSQQANTNGNHMSLRKGQKRQLETPGWKELYEENQLLKNKLNASTHKSSELSNKLTEATDRIRTLQEHIRRLKKTLAEVVLESVEAIEPKSAKKLKT